MQCVKVAQKNYGLISHMKKLSQMTNILYEYALETRNVLKILYKLSNKFIEDLERIMDFVDNDIYPK